jgi:retron-type reverse transcriptase
MDPELLQRLVGALLDARLSPSDIVKLIRDTDWETSDAPDVIGAELRKRAVAHRNALLEISAGRDLDLARIYRNLLAATGRKHIPSYLMLLEATCLDLGPGSGEWRQAYVRAYGSARRPSVMTLASRLLSGEALRSDDIVGQDVLAQATRFALLGHVSGGKQISAVKAFRLTVGKEVPQSEWSESLTSALTSWPGPPVTLADLGAAPKSVVAAVVDAAPADRNEAAASGANEAPSLVGLRQVAAAIRSNGFNAQVDRRLLREIRTPMPARELVAAAEYLLISTGVVEHGPARASIEQQVRFYTPLLHAAMDLLSAAPKKRLGAFAKLETAVKEELLKGRFLGDSAALWVGAGPARRAEYLRLLSERGVVRRFVADYLPAATGIVPVQTLVGSAWREAIAPFLSASEVRRELLATPRRTRLDWFSTEQAKAFLAWVASPALPDGDVVPVAAAFRGDLVKWCYAAAGEVHATRAIVQLLSRLDALAEWQAGNDLWLVAHRRHAVPLASLFPDGLSAHAFVDVSSRARLLRKIARPKLLELRARGGDGLAWEQLVLSAGTSTDDQAPVPTQLRAVILEDETAALRAAGLRPELFAADVRRTYGLWPLIAAGVNYFQLARWLDERLTLEERRQHVSSIREAYAKETATAVALEVALLVSLSDAYLVRRLARQARTWSADKRGCAFDVLYRTYDLPKRSGGVRTITVPASALKRLQRRIYERVLAPTTLHPTAHGFRKQRSILTNAREHAGKRMVVSMDIESFFRSTGYPLILRACGDAAGKHLSPGALRLLTDLCCYDGALPTGAPTSPALGNLVLRRVDAALHKAAARHRIDYTRYADDLTFSGEQHVQKILPFVRRVLGELGYSLKEKKVNIFRKGRRQVVTGLVVNETPNLPRRRRRQLRAAVHRRLNGGTPELHGRPLSDAALFGHIGHLGLVKPHLAAAYREQLREGPAADHQGVTP